VRTAAMDRSQAIAIFFVLLMLGSVLAIGASFL
jgi:hypothetical protein